MQIKTVIDLFLKGVHSLLMAKPEKSKKHSECEDSGNSERPLIDLIKTLITDEFKKVNDALDKFRLKLEQQETRNEERHRNEMTAIEDLQAAINESTVAQTDLTTAVNAAIVRIGTPPANDAAITAAAVAVRANAASDVTLKDALNTALGNTPPTP